MVTLHVRLGRKQKNVYIIAFDEIVSIEMAEKLQGRELFVTRAQMPTLEEGQYLVRDLVGSQVITDDGQSFGELTEVLSPGANDVYVVTTKTGKEVLLPAIPDCILEVDITNKKIIVHILPGLLDDSDEN
jgi:16S rRNA processing protein RimM